MPRRSTFRKDDGMCHLAAMLQGLSVYDGVVLPGSSVGLLAVTKWYVTVVV